MNNMSYEGSYSVESGKRLKQILIFATKAYFCRGESQITFMCV